VSRLSHHAGLAAEEGVARAYVDRGGTVLAERVRTPAGEIDLIVALPDTLVFVEVKARRTARIAAGALGAAQMQRIARAAEIWLDDTGRGGLTPCRFDAALVDGEGRVEILEHAFAPGA